MQLPNKLLGASFHLSFFKVQVTAPFDWTNTSKMTNLALRNETRAWGDQPVLLAHEDDNILLTKMADGNKQAVAELYARHHERVFHFIRRFINQSETAEDITNDVFIEIWQKASTFEGRSKVSSWILGVARYKALSEIRKNSRLQSGGDELFDALEDDADTPELTTQKMDKGAALKRCIASLSSDHRIVIDLVYYHEKSIAEVSEILDIPISTVKTRAHYARKHLSSEMGLSRYRQGVAMNTIDEKTREELSQLLPWYANGTLDAKDIARIETALEQDAQLRNELELVLEDQAASIDLFSHESVPTSMVERFKVVLNQEAAKIEANSTEETKPPTGNFLSRVVDALFPTRTVTYMASAAMLLLAVQSGAIISLMSDLPGNIPAQVDSATDQNGGNIDGLTSTLTAGKNTKRKTIGSSVPPSKVKKVVLVRVLFRETANMELITVFLKNNGGQIIRGPESNGEFLLMIELADNEDKQQLMDRLRKQAPLFKALSEKN